MNVIILRALACYFSFYTKRILYLQNDLFSYLIHLARQSMKLIFVNGLTRDSLILK